MGCVDGTEALLWPHCRGTTGTRLWGELGGKGVLGPSGRQHHGPPGEILQQHGCCGAYLWFSLVASAALWGAGLVLSPGLWVTFLGCWGGWGGEVTQGRWLGTLWSQAEVSAQPSTLALASALRLGR